MTTKLFKVKQILQKRGISYGFYLLWVMGFLKPLYFIFSLWSPSQLRRLLALLALGLGTVVEIFSLLNWGWRKTLRLTFMASGVLIAIGQVRSFIELRRKAHQARQQTEQFLAAGGHSRFTHWSAYPLSPSIRKVIDDLVEPGEPFVIGHIDRDGRVYSPYGSLPYVKNISKTDFVPPRRFSVDIVLLEGLILIRKHFRGDYKRFLQEWYNLVRLQSKKDINTPTVYRVDEAQTLLYKNYIMGRTIRDILVEAGAEILTIQTKDDPELATLDQEARIYTVLQRGLTHFSECFTPAFIPTIEQQMNLIHACGIATLSLTFGNIIVDDQEQPWLIDLEQAQSFSSISSLLFRLRRDQDRLKFNRIYDQNILTERSARTLLTAEAEKHKGWYAPLDFGQGLTIGGFWSIESGTGRWEYINHSVMAPLIMGKRILDLGSNNGVMPLLMLRSGARSVVGVELSPESVETARLLHDILSWHDLKSYDFQINQGNMTDILKVEWGEFDVVTALCTLYYLEPYEMAEVVSRAAEMVPLVIVQANSDTRSEAANYKAYKSSVNFLKKILRENGFPDVTVVAPTGYSRPLIIGKNTSII